MTLSRQKAERPPIFDERNKAFWSHVRRFLVWFIREMDEWYDWNTPEEIRS